MNVRNSYVRDTSAHDSLVAGADHGLSDIERNCPLQSTACNAI